MFSQLPRNILVSRNAHESDFPKLAKNWAFLIAFTEFTVGLHTAPGVSATLLPDYDPPLLLRHRGLRAGPCSCGSRANSHTALCAGSTSSLSRWCSSAGCGCSGRSSAFRATGISARCSSSSRSRTSRTCSHPTGFTPSRATADDHGPADASTTSIGSSTTRACGARAGAHHLRAL